MTAAAIEPAVDTAALKDTVDRLVELLDSEAELLGAMKASEIGSLQPTKSLLIDSYERMAKALRDDEERLNALAPAERSGLGEAMTRLTQATRRNEMALRAVTGANERLMRAIIDEVRRQQADGAVYTVDGAVAQDGKAPPVSVRIDEQL